MLAEKLDVDADLIRQRMQLMLDRGAIRRIGVVPNHYQLGIRANGMSVWDVDDEKIAHLGERIGGLDFVSHAYHRPRRLPEWPYNLFAMVHGKSRDEVAGKVKLIAGILGDAQRQHEVLFSTRVLKKSGLRLLEQTVMTSKKSEVA